MLPPCSSSLVSSSHSYDETITNIHPRNDAAACLEPTLAARSTCATKDVTRWFSGWWSGSVVSTPIPQGCCGSLYTVYQWCRVAIICWTFGFLFYYISSLPSRHPWTWSKRQRVVHRVKTTDYRVPGTA